ncbi:MAG: ribokinase [Hyphomicrobiaceae bacterium]
MQESSIGSRGVAWIVGSINRDIVGYVARHGRPGETVLGSRSAFYPGGKGANQAVAVARLQGDARLIGCVGADAFGAEMTAFLQDEGVDVRGVAIVPSVATGVALIVVDAQSENIITVLPGANGEWPSDWPEGDGVGVFDPKPGDVVAAQLEIPMAVVAAAFARARSVGVMTVLNPSPYGEAVQALLALADVVVVNELELGQVTGAAVDARDDRALLGAASRLFERGVMAGVVTLGARGAAVVERAGVTRVEGIKVVARDTTGAGDCFTGAVVAELLCGVGLADAVRFAVRAAAMSVMRDGAAVSFPRRAEL